MIALENILSQEIIQRLGWTLLHFVWQAAVVALLVAILLRLLRKSTANLRYIIACLALGLIVLLPVITIQLVPVSAPHMAANIEPAPVPTVLPTLEMPAAETTVIEKPSQSEIVTPASSVPWKQRAIETLEPGLPYIVSGWLIGVFALSIWHLGGWAQLQRLRRRMVRQVDDTLHSKLSRLAKRLRVSRTVQLMESALVQIPTVVGWLRPVILLPASALTGLTSEQLEAILAHELAHIKRFDYLVNILQTVVEILGFYHPAVWWVSHKIRAERENCCDDLAVSISGDRVCYAGALTSMEEIRTGQGQLAVAATGGNLFKRIYRLLGKDKTDKTGFSWIPAATAILLIIALVIPTTLAFTTKSDSQQPDSKIEVHVENDRSGESQQEKEPSVDDILTVLPTIAKSPSPPDKDKAHVKANCLVVEVPLDSKIDTETLREAEKILGNKINLSNTTVDVILRQVAKATAAAKDESTENKRITEQQFNAFVEMLTSKGYMKILMIPILEVMDGQVAKIIGTVSPLHESSLEITPHVLADGDIILDVKADLSSQDTPVFEEPAPVSSRQFSTRMRASSGESLIIGGLTETGKSSETDRNVKGPKEKSKEVLFILTPTIINPTPKPQKKTDVQVEGEETASAENSWPSKFTADKTRIIHFPKDQVVCTLKVRDISSDDADRGLLSQPGWVILGQAQGDVSVPGGKDLRLEVAGDITDFSFLADLKPNDLQVLILSHKGISDEELVQLKGLTGLLGLDLGSTAIKGPGLIHLAPLTSLRKLSLFNTQVSDAGLEHLSTLRSLKYLNLYITQVKGPGLKHLKSLTSLVRLDLAATPITNQSLVHLAEMTWLKELELQDTQIGNKGLAHLKPLRSLEELILGYADLKQGYSPITDEGLVYLKELGSLKNLYLLRTRVTDAGLAHLRNLKKLEALLLTETQITGEGLAFLKDLPTLKYLDLNKTAVTDEGLVYLKDLKSLRTLYIPAENLSRTDLEELEKALPDCTINGRKPIAATHPPIPDSDPAEREQKTDLPVKDKKAESADKLKCLGLALAMYANDHDDKYPDSLHELRGYLKTEDFAWTWQNVEYLAHGKTIAVRPDTVIAYDKKLLAERKGTNVLFNDSHVEFVKPERLKELGISATEILIETRLLSVSEDFLKDIGLDANSVDSSGAWSEHLVADPAAEPNAETYSLLLDDLHNSFLLKAVQAHKDAHVLVSPRILTRECKTAEIGIMTEEYYVLGYTEPNDPSDKPVPKTDKVELGTRLWLKPELTPDNQNIKLDFKMEFRQLLGYEERKYKGKYIYLVPRTEVVSTEMPYLVPDGNTLLIGGQKITDKASAAPILSRLPVVGGLFRSRDKTKDQRILLILVKPIINPQQKASKILPGQEDSEEHIKSLASQLEKKLNPPAEPK